MEPRHVVNPDQLHHAGVFSHGLRVGNRLFIGAMLPIDRDGRLTGPDVETQAQTSFASLGAVLKEAGMGWEHLAKLNIYMTDLSDFETFKAVRGRILSPPYPISTLVQISRLVTPGATLLVEGMAHITGQGGAGTMQHLNPPTVPAGVQFSQGVRIDDTLYISGQLPIDQNKQLVGPGDIEAQTECVFRHLQSILAAAGAGLEHLVKLNVYLTDLAHYDQFRAVRGRWLQAPYPISTLVEVKGLVVPGALLEVEGIAILR